MQIFIKIIWDVILKIMLRLNRVIRRVLKYTRCIQKKKKKKRPFSFFTAEIYTLVECLKI